ncbi:MAG: glycosyltransferase family 2 protein [Planctomycetota bacterium]|jgi:glycosyltransferase involved in cell wall biosynthesis
MTGAETVSVVMPVYNEGAVIQEVIRDWLAVSDELGGALRLILINDGSRDDTRERIDACRHPLVRARHRENAGHGPSILEGYRTACRETDWVFQVDSDNEISADQFPRLWEARDGLDGIFGYRANRTQTPVRFLVSLVGVIIVRAGGSKPVRDPNCPFRLLRAPLLARCLETIPPDTFAPNIMISYFFMRHYRIENLPCYLRPRQHGKATLNDFNILPKAARSFLETLNFVARLDRRHTPEGRERPRPHPYR